MNNIARPFPAYRGGEPYVFVCYAHGDAGTVYPTIQWLKDRGFNIWYDEGIDPGSTWRDEVALAITQSSVFLYFVSPASIVSPHCQQELNFALSREREFLAAYLVETALTPGMELSIGAKQALMPGRLTTQQYRNKIDTSLRSLLRGSGSGRHPSGEAVVPVNKESVVILPFANASKDQGSQYLGEGIANELINGLSRIEVLRVVSGSAVTTEKLEDLRRKLNVETALSGSVQKAGDRVRVNVQLTQTADGTILWSERYDDTMADIFDLQDRVAAEIVGALKIKLAPEHKNELLVTGTDNSVAYNAYLLGLHEERKDAEASFEKAIEHYNLAIEQDPAFGDAHFRVGKCFWELQVFGRDRAEMGTRAAAAFSAAREAGFEPDLPWAELNRRIDPESRPALRDLADEAIGKIQRHEDDWRAFEYVQLGHCLGAAGLYHASLEYLEHYIRSKNSNSMIWAETHSEIGKLYAAVGRFEKAISVYDQLLLLHDSSRDRLDRAMLLGRTGQYDRADADIALLPPGPVERFARFYQLVWQGAKSEAKALFASVADERDLQSRFRFWGYLLIDEYERAIEHIEESIARGAPIFYIRILLASVLPGSVLRSVELHPRLQQLLSARGVDSEWKRGLFAAVRDLNVVTGIKVRQDDEY